MITAGNQPEVDDNNDGGGDSIFAEINITPLTDVFLVMVVIFMVSALAVQAERNDEKKQDEKQKKEAVEKESSGIKIILPPATAPVIDTTKASLVLEVSIEGNVYVAGKPMTDDKLDNLFHAAFQHDKNTQVVLKADKGVPHGRVVNLMERAKQTGLSRLAIGTGGK